MILHFLLDGGISIEGLLYTRHKLKNKFKLCDLNVQLDYGAQISCNCQHKEIFRRKSPKIRELRRNFVVHTMNRKQSFLFAFCRLLSYEPTGIFVHKCNHRNGANVHFTTANLLFNATIDTKYVCAPSYCVVSTEIYSHAQLFCGHHDDRGSHSFVLRRIASRKWVEYVFRCFHILH